MRSRVETLAVAWLAVVAGGGVGRAQDPGGTYRADNLGIEFTLVPHQGHYAARLTKVVSPTAPIYWVKLPEGMFQIEVGDSITRLDDQAIDAPGDLLNHVAATTVDFIDARTGLPHRGSMTLPPARAAAPPPGGDASRKLRALIVADFASGLDGVAQDRNKMRSMLVPFERQGLAEVTVLSDARAVGRDRILAYFRSQPDASPDTVLFYYSGHGATDPRLGHYLAPANGPGLLRSDLRREIARLNPRLTVILTDCCSTSAGIPPPMAMPPSDRADEVAYDLFFRARGVLDLTGASYDAATGVGQAGWGDALGGYFTSALYSMIRERDKDELDTNGDGRVSWAELMTPLSNATNGRYQALRFGALRGLGQGPRLRAEDIQSLRSQAEQRPQTFR